MNSRLRSIERSHYVIKYALGNIVLNDGDMFICCCMIDRIDTPCAHHIVQSGLVPNGPEDWHKAYIQRLTGNSLFELNLYIIKIELAVLKQQQRFRAATQNLATQFRANRASRTSNHHHFITDATFEQFFARRNCIPPEQVCNIDILNIIHLDPTASQIHETGNTTNMQRELL
ncbi:hypothetical protein D3C84_772230 [compost metagenome]